MKASSRLTRAAFSLLELVVVLSIIGIVTALAIRSLDRVEDQRRYEAAQRELEEIEAAVLGSPEDRAADGSPTLLGFVADLARLPRPVEENIVLDGTTASALTLRELWVRPNDTPSFALLDADASAGVSTENADLGVKVASGWRGPYLRLPLGAPTARDGWGNPFITPLGGSGATARLFNLAGAPVVAVTDFIGAVRHLGADGVPTGAIYDEDASVAFGLARTSASIGGRVTMLDNDGENAPPSNNEVVVRVFCPDPSDATKIRVFQSPTLTDNGEMLNYTINAPALGELTIGPRVIRAYSITPGTTTRVRASAVKTVTLRAGLNPGVNLSIDRNFVEPAP